MSSSVAMCTYNGEKFLKQQLNSILNQTLAVDEIIICDDRSTDSTISILNSYKEKYPDLFKIFINNENIGSVKNFEKAISLCKNEIIFLSDQDDIWVTNKVEVITTTFKNNQEILVIATNGYGIDDLDQLADVITVWDVIKFVKANGYLFDYFNILNLKDNFCTGATMALKIEIRNELFPIPVVRGLHHDKWIALVAASTNRLVFLDEKLIYYREHSNQQVGNVLYKNTEKDKFSITNYFSIEKENKSFSDYKKLLKEFASAYKTNLLLLEKFPAHKNYFTITLTKLKERFKNNNSELNKKFPVRAKFLKFADRFLGKRKI